MPKPMPKLKRIGRQRIPKISRHESLSRLFKNARLKFYAAKGSHTFAIGLIPHAMPGMQTATVAKFNPAKRAFENFAECNLALTGKGVYMGEASKQPEIYDRLKDGRDDFVRFYARQKTGFNIFRLFLNEAIALAKAQGLTEVSLTAQNVVLQEYYGRLGFKFEGKEGKGLFTIKPRPHS